MAIVIDVRGTAAAIKLLDQFQGRQLQNKMRVAIRAGAKPFQAALKAEAAHSDVPRSFQKVPAAKISTHGGASGGDVEARVRPKSPLFNIFEPGAGAHTIAPGSSVTGRPGRSGGRPRKGALSGPAGSGSWDSTGRKRPAAFFSTRPVRHPGMGARPLLPGAFAAAEPAASDAIADAIFRITGGTPIGTA